MATAYDQAQSAESRLTQAQIEVQSARDSVEKNFEGLRQTKRVGNVILLVIRPQEAVAALQAGRLWPAQKPGAALVLTIKMVSQTIGL